MVPTTKATIEDRHDALDEKLAKEIGESDNPEYGKKALRSVNRIRRALGGEPLTDLRPGRREESTNCPVFNSLADLNGVIQLEAVGGRVEFNAIPTDRREALIAAMRPFNSGVNTYPINDEDEVVEASIDDEAIGDFVSYFDGGYRVGDEDDERITAHRDDSVWELQEEDFRARAALSAYDEELDQ